MKWWITCTSAAEAPKRDFEMVKSLFSYKEIDEEIASVALGALENHQWYFEESLIPLCLFDNNIGEDTKQKISEIMLTHPHKVSTTVWVCIR